MSKKAVVQGFSRLFHVLSDQTRLTLLLTLKDEGELNVTDLCTRLRLPQPTVSHHLALLRTSGLVKNRRSGKQVYYSVDKTRFVKARAAAAEVLS